MRHTADGNVTVESYSHENNVEGAEEISKAAFDDFITNLPSVSVSDPRNLAREIDSILQRLANANIP
jgi:hypothetical protein